MTGPRKKMIFAKGTAREKEDVRVKALNNDGCTFDVTGDPMTTIAAMNSRKNASIFKNADYGIIEDVLEILPLLTKARDDGTEKKTAPPKVKMRKATVKKEASPGITSVDADMNLIRQLEILRMGSVQALSLKRFWKNGSACSAGKAMMPLKNRKRQGGIICSVLEK